MVGLFGVRGEVKAQLSRIGEDALRDGTQTTLRFGDGRPSRAIEVRRVRPHKNVAVLTLDGVGTADDAQALVGAELEMPRDDVRLAQNEYFDDDLIGCKVVEKARVLGTVAAVRHYPAQDMLELEDGALIPLVAAFVREIDVARRSVHVELPPGLIEGEPETG